MIATVIVDSAFEVHRELGPGLLESAYEMAFCRELNLRNLTFERQRPVPVSYKGVSLDCGYRIDILVEANIVIELKAVEALTPLHEAQLFTYLKLAHCHLGFPPELQHPSPETRLEAHRLPTAGAGIADMPSLDFPSLLRCFAVKNLLKSHSIADVPDVRAVTENDQWVLTQF